MKAVIFSFLLFLPIIFFSQEDDKPQSDCPEPDNSEAVKLFKKAKDHKKYETKERIGFLKEALKLEPGYAQANYEMAMIIVRRDDERGVYPKQAQAYFEAVVQVCPNYHSNAYFYLAYIYFTDKKWKEAAEYAKKFLDFKTDDPKKIDRRFDDFVVDAKVWLKYAKFYDDMFSHPVPFDPKPVDGICTQYDEYLPIISPDNQLALFTRAEPQSSFEAMKSDKMKEIFYQAARMGEKFQQGFPLPDPFNHNPGEGGATLTIDNNHLFYTICKDDDPKYRNCDIWYCDRIKGKWLDIKNLEEVNAKDAWDSQPSISADGKTLYFASDRPGGYGGSDIWMSKKDSLGHWSKPVNLGPKINTAGEEKSPFIHTDSQTLYFSSAPNRETHEGGHLGLGGFDIFFSKRDEKGEWSKPQNIGYPINTASDDLGFFVSTDGHYGYFTSKDPQKTKNRTNGGLDIYSFELYKEARPEGMLLVDGQIKDENNKPVENAKVEVKDAVTKKSFDAMVDSLTGEFRVAVSAEKKTSYVITAKAKDKAFFSQMITVQDSAVKPDRPLVEAKMDLKPVMNNTVYPLNNIYYKTNAAEITSESKVVLDEFAKYLKENPNMIIEIRGHTDNAGSPAGNQSLSADRANAVWTYLIEQGVEKSRLSFKGFGQAKPVADNGTETGRAKNRRTEFYIVSN